MIRIALGMLGLIYHGTRTMAEHGLRPACRPKQPQFEPRSINGRGWKHEPVPQGLNRSGVVTMGSGERSDWSCQHRADSCWFGAAGSSRGDQITVSSMQRKSVLGIVSAIRRS
jgi:hypothetical protein